MEKVRQEKEKQKEEIKLQRELETKRKKELVAKEREKVRKLQAKKKAMETQRREDERIKQAEAKDREEREAERQRQEKERLQRERTERELQMELARLAGIRRVKECEKVVRDMMEFLLRQKAWEETLRLFDGVLEQYGNNGGDGGKTPSSSFSSSSTSSSSSSFSTGILASPISFNMIPVEVAAKFYANYRRQDGWLTHQSRCQMSDMGMSVCTNGELLGLLTFSVRILRNRYFVTIDTFGVVSSARKRGIGTLIMSFFCLWFKKYVSGAALQQQYRQLQRIQTAENSPTAILFVETAKTDTASNFWEHVVGLVENRHDPRLTSIYHAAHQEGKGDTFFLPLTTDRSRCFLKPQLENEQFLLVKLSEQYTIFRRKIQERPLNLVKPEDAHTDATHEIAATTVGWTGPWNGEYEDCIILFEHDETYDVRIASDGDICKNVLKMYIRPLPDQNCFHCGEVAIGMKKSKSTRSMFTPGAWNGKPTSKTVVICAKCQTCSKCLQQASSVRKRMAELTDAGFLCEACC